LPEVAHVEIRAADRAIAEMIGLGFGHIVSVDGSIARDHGISTIGMIGGGLSFVM
jgi:hypothetical protein